MTRSGRHHMKAVRAEAPDEVKGSASRKEASAPTHEEIAREAYANVPANGARDGHAEEDWLEAEQLISRRP